MARSCDPQRELISAALLPFHVSISPHCFPIPSHSCLSPSPFFQRARINKNQCLPGSPHSSSPLVPHFICPPSPAPAIPLALLSCLHVLLLHTLFPKAPQPLFASGLTHGMLPVLSFTAVALHPFPTPTLSLALDVLRPPSVQSLRRLHPASLLRRLSRLPVLFLISRPPPSLFALPPPSVIPSSSSLSVSVYWVLSSTHSLVDKWFILPKNPHHRPQTSLFNQPLLLHSCHSLAGCR